MMLTIAMGFDAYCSYGRMPTGPLTLYTTLAFEKDVGVEEELRKPERARDRTIEEGKRKSIGI